MRKKLDTRFPAARIKKIMQADEDVGKIALAVPVLVSKALELFLQDLCDRTYEITLQKGAKTMNSVHLKHCVQSYNVFDFLREIVSKVPDYGQTDAFADDRTIPKRRKTAGEDINESDEESKRSRTNETSHASSSGRGRGRSRGRGRGRARAADRETAAHHIESDPCTSVANSVTKPTPNLGNLVENISDSKQQDDDMNTDCSSPVAVRNFDLNADLVENEGGVSAATAHASSAVVATKTKHGDYSDWTLSEVDRMAIDPLQFANIYSRLDEEEEDYDEV